MIDLTLLDKTKTNAIVIRHADRNSMVQGQVSQPLNETGKKNAELLGEKLRGFMNYAFFSSPVDRCYESVEHLQKGIFGKQKIQNTLSTILGEPGPFVIDRKNNAFKRHSCHKVIIKQIEHEQLDGIRDTQDGAKILVNFVTEQMNASTLGTLLIFVTHDSILAPVIFELTGEKFGYENWPDFSDGFIIEKNTCGSSDEYKVIRKNQYFDLRKF